MSNYFQIQALSRSDLREIDESTPLYKKRLDGLAPPRVQTPDMAFGSALDAILCGGKGPDPLDGYYVVPFDDFRTKAAKAARETAINEFGYDRDHVITYAMEKRLMADGENEIKRLNACVEIVKSTPRVASLLLGMEKHKPEVQRVLQWNDDRTGEPCKSMPDRLIPGVAIPDLKCSAETSLWHFLIQAKKFWYTTQAYMAQEGWRQETGEILPVQFVVVHNQGESAEIYVASDEFIEHGRKRFERAVDHYRRCRDSGQWVSRTHNQLVLATPPKSWSYEFA